MKYLYLLSACLLLAACEAPGNSSSTATRSQALESPEVLIHKISDQKMVRGFLEPVPANTDAPRVLTISDGLARLGVEPRTRVLDVKFTDGGAFVLDATNVLSFHDGKTSRKIDYPVHGPLSVRAGKVAYMKGGIPDMTLHWASTTGEAESLTPEVKGWSPALSEDGESVIFVANVEGRPQLLHRTPDGQLFEVAWDGRFPTAPVAPQWRGDTLVFEDEMGVAVLSLSEGEIVADYPDAHLLPDWDGGPWIEEEGVRTQLKEVAQ